MILTPLLGLGILLIIITNWSINKLNKIQECRREGIPLKIIIKVLWKNWTMSDEEREKKAIETML